MASPSEFPLQDLLPKKETGAERFLRKYPDYDGRNTIIAIFDTGVDPGADGLQVTTDGKRKIIDIIDCTGSGDVDTSTISTMDENGYLTGLTGRQLKVPSEWKNPTGKFHLGIKAAYELFPSRLCDRLKKEYRKNVWNPAHLKSISDAIRDLEAFESKGKQQTLMDELAHEDLQQRVELLKNFDKDYDYPPPVFDCIVFHNGQDWRAVIDTTQVGQLSDCTLLPDYRLEPVYGTFDDENLLNYTVSIQDDGNLLTVVVNVGSHGTHVACIAAGNFVDSPEKNGIAPGAQILSVKIGDTRLDSMETGTGIVRGLIASKKYGCDLVNMSYGEACQKPNEGRILELCNEFVDEHGIIFVSSAGNNGPALSTVGAPGGTAASVISVGAHVTPSMMIAQYSLLEKLPSMQYTWTSRGPCADGALGVSISAPGAAIASVPNWTLNRSQLMNGTSMSSPNACGGIALILSGLKARNSPYSPWSVRRAVENTTSPVDGADNFSIGYGLLQVDKGFEYMQNFAERTELNDLHFEISCGTFFEKRGVYLREPYEMHSPSFIHVRIKPCYRENTDRKDKIKLQLQITLVATASWVEAPSFLLLNSSARSFQMKVDPRDLCPGANYCEVCGYDSSCVELGPLFRIPVTVTKPISLQDPSSCISETIVLESGKIKRLFFAVPSIASWSEMTLTSLEDCGKFTVVVDALQLHKDRSFKHLYSSNQVTLGSRECKDFNFKLQGGKTLEVCLSSWWSTLKNKKITYSIKFRSLLPSEEKIVMHSSSGLHTITVTAPIRRENLNVTISLDNLVESIRPTSSQIKPLSVKDSLPNGRQIYSINLDYNFTIEKLNEIRPNVSLLSHLLYESLYESQLWMIFDRNKQHLASGDAFPHQYKIKLDKGSYLLKLQVRHDNRDLLERLKDLPLLLEHKLSNSVSVDVYTSQLKALSGGSKISSNYWLDKDEIINLYCAPVSDDRLPKGTKPGMYLKGTISYSTSGKFINYPFIYNIGPMPITTAITSNNTNNDYGAAIKKYMITWLGKLDYNSADALYKELEKKYEGDLALQIERMKMLESSAMKDASADKLDKTIAFAQSVIDQIDQDALLNFYGMVSDKSDEAVKHKSEMDEKKKYLVEALLCKGKCLGFLTKTLDGADETVTKHTFSTSATDNVHCELSKWNDAKSSMVAMDSVYCELSKWIDMKSSKVAGFVIVHATLMKHYGRAITAVQNQLKEASAPKTFYEELISLLEKLNWCHVRDYYKKSLFRKFPKNYVLF